MFLIHIYSKTTLKGTVFRRKCVKQKQRQETLINLFTPLPHPAWSLLQITNYNYLKRDIVSDGKCKVSGQKCTLLTFRSGLCSVQCAVWQKIIWIFAYKPVHVRSLFTYDISGPETRHLPLHRLKSRQAQFSRRVRLFLGQCE